jgi:hypothetical protein
MLSIVPILATANNQTGHTSYIWWDDLSTVGAMNRTGGVSGNNDAYHANLNSSNVGIVSYIGKKWINITGGNYVSFNFVSRNPTNRYNRLTLSYESLCFDSSGYLLTYFLKDYNSRANDYIDYWTSPAPLQRIRARNNASDIDNNGNQVFTSRKSYVIKTVVSRTQMFNKTGGTGFNAYMLVNDSSTTKLTYRPTSTNPGSGIGTYDTIMFSTSGGACMVTSLKLWAGNTTDEPIPGGAPTPPTITLTYPTNKSHENSITWNKSILLTADKKVNCILNNSDWTFIRNNSNQWMFRRTTSASDRQYIIKYSCNSSATAWRNATINVTIDNTNPILVIGQYRGKWFGQDHGSERNGNNSYWNSSFWISWLTSDTYLYKMQTRINKIVGNVSVYTRLISANSTVTYNLTKQVKNNATYTDGNYTVLLETTDSHTATEFSEAMTSDINEKVISEKGVSLKEITHELEKGDFKITIPSDISMTPIREDDKISYDIVAEKEGATYQIIEGDSVEPIQNSEYPCHFVVNFKDMNGYWFDCVGLDNPKVTEIEKNKKYRIDYDIGKSLEVKESSLGGLNYVKKSFNFYIDTVKPKFYCTGSGTNYSAHCKNTTGTAGLAITFNTTEAVNFTQKISNTSCGSGFLSSSVIPAFNNLTKTAVFTGLNSNKTYHINITIYDRADNQKSFCFNQTTKAIPITKGNITLNVPMNYLEGHCPSPGRTQFTEWRWYINGTEVSRTNNISGRINISNVSFSSIPTNQRFAYDGYFSNYAFIAGSDFVMYSRYNNLLTNEIKYIFKGDTATLGFWNFIKGAYDFFNISVFGIPTFNNTFSNTTQYLNSTRGMIMYSKVNEFSSHWRLYDSNLYYIPRMTTNRMIYNLTSRTSGAFTFACRSFDGVSYSTWANTTPFYYPKRSNVSINIYHENNHTVKINKRITLNVVGLDFDFTSVNITSSGSFTIFRNLTPGDYELSFYGDDYLLRQRIVTIIPDVSSTLSLYGINKSEGSSLDVIVRNRAYIGLQNISVELLRFYPDINEWLTVANGVTDPAGLTRFYINYGGAKYKIVLSYFGRVIYTSDGEYINRDTYRFTVDLYDYYVNWDDLQTSPLRVNVLTNPRTISFSWAEASPSIQSIGLRVWEDNITSYEVISTQTSTNSAGMLTFSVPDNTKTYTAWTYINYSDGTIRYLDSASYAGIPASQDDFKEWGLLFAIILFFAVIGGTLYISRDPAVTVLACALLVFILATMKLVILTKVELGIIIPGLLVAAYYLHKRGV